MGALLRIEAVEVGERRLEARVRVDAAGALTTRAWPGMADRLWSLLPGLARHSCHNDGGVSFREELADTQLAHCVEHVAAELMALAGSPRNLRGETRWDFSADGPGVYRVALEYDDDLVALGALRESVAIVEWAALEDREPPSPSNIAQGLRGLRLTGS